MRLARTTGLLQPASDFYLPSYDCYLEVKGYETERDLAKWAALSNLLIIKKQLLYQLRKDPQALVRLLNQRDLPLCLEPRFTLEAASVIT